MGFPAPGLDNILSWLLVELFSVASYQPRMAKGGEHKMHLPFIEVVMTLVVVGVLLWLVNRFLPMQGTIKSILNGVLVIAVVLWLLNAFGLYHYVNRDRL